MFNACLPFSYFPKQWRCAKVLILKKHNKSNYSSPSSFRPISILNALSKLFEKILLSRLSSLAEKHEWFSPAQHGFRKGKSSESAALSLTSRIEGNRKRKLATCCAFLDIQSAFDAAWRPAVIKGLIAKGCPLYLVKVIASFLSDRSAIISDKNSSILAHLQLGCPQGSALSPFLWNVLVDAVLNLQFEFDFAIIAYADDLVLISWNKSAAVATANLQLLCDEVVLWGHEVKLTLNASKTVFIIFFAKAKNPQQSITINNTVIPQSKSCVYLGLAIDFKLNWRTHIENKCLAAKRLWFLVQRCARLSWGLSRDKLQLLYKAIIVPTILYGCVVWAKTTVKASIVKLLHSAQRPCAILTARVFKTTATATA